MRRFALALLSTTILGAGFAQVASAADIPVRGRAPAYQAPVVEPYSNWSGFYLGGSVGGRWSDVDWTTTIAPVAINPATNPAAFDSSSFRAGVYGGVNFQFAPMWVAGIEADFGWADNKSTRTGIPGLSVANDTTSVRQRWDGSLRGRLGFLVTPATLLYATGGASWIDVEANTTCSLAGGYCLAGRNQTNETTRTGWTLGGGIETMLMGNWLARAEYRYADYGKIDNTFFAGTADRFTVSEDLRTHTALVGLAYKFGGGPVYAKY